MKLKTRDDYRRRRHLRVRQKISGTAARPRMSVFLSTRHMYVQFVDDAAGKTLASASTVGEEMKASAGKQTVAVAKALGTVAAKAAKAKGIETVVLDRGGFAYGARLKALADAAREAGLKF